MRNVKIRAVLNGWIVDVGCQILVYEGKEGRERLLKDLKEYMMDPSDKEKHMTATAVNKHLMDCPQAGEPEQESDHPIGDLLANHLAEQAQREVLTRGVTAQGGTTTGRVRSR